jgi:hypothetical protein
MATNMSLRHTLKKYDKLENLLLDKDLAALGDSYVNFIYSLAMSQRFKRPIGAKVDNQTLAEAVMKSGLRKFLPHRVDRHARGNAAEAFLVFAWLSDLLEFNDYLNALSEEDDPAAAFTTLIKKILNKLGMAHDSRQK